MKRVTAEEQRAVHRLPTPPFFSFSPILYLVMKHNPLQSVSAGICKLITVRAHLHSSALEYFSGSRWCDYLRFYPPIFSLLQTIYLVLPGFFLSPFFVEIKSDFQKHKGIYLGFICIFSQHKTPFCFFFFVRKLNDLSCITVSVDNVACVCVSVHVYSTCLSEFMHER